MFLNLMPQDYTPNRSLKTINCGSLVFNRWLDHVRERERVLENVFIWQRTLRLPYCYNIKLVTAGR